MLHSVVQVLPVKGFKVYVYFADGKIKLFDILPFIGKGVFKALENEQFFLERCTVLNNTLAWDVSGNFDPTKCLDIDPETIYSQGVDVQDPLTDLAS